MPVIDTGQVQEFEPIAAGTYNATFTEFENIEASKTSGEPYIKFTFTGDEGEAEGRKFWANKSLNTKALWALKRDLIAMGADPEDVTGVFDTDDILPDLVGNEVRLKVLLDEYEGEPNNKIDRILKA
jgi:hypothetical protein